MSVMFFGSNQDIHQNIPVTPDQIFFVWNYAQTMNAL